MLFFQSSIIRSALLGSLLVLAAPFVGAQTLELKRVSLSSAGLAYFEYEARVENDAVLSLQVGLDQVNDVLKSLVVYDDKGGIGGISLPGKDPIAEVLRQLPFDVSALSESHALLQALRGAEITVSSPSALRGRIMSVQKFAEVPQARTGGIQIERHRVMLMTETGMQQFVLEEAGNLQFVDAALRSQIQRALVAMDSNRARDSRTLELTSKGKGLRVVRVAYVASAPIWKIAYRLTLPSTVPSTLPAKLSESKAQLQGWAVIENMSGQDWKNVELTLTSGRPVTFRQDLYSAVFNARPELPIELPGRIVPQSDRGAIAALPTPLPRSAAFAPAPAPAPAPAAPAPAAALALRSNQFAPSPAIVDSSRFAEAAEPVLVQDAATQVNYRFPLPVTVTTGRSLSIPIILADLSAERSAFFQPSVDARYPLAAIELRNDTNATLPPGAVAVYESDGRSGAFVGDSRLSVLPMGENRYLSFAIDQKLSMATDVSQRQDIKRLLVERATLTIDVVDRLTRTLTVKPAGSVNTAVVVELTKLNGWDLLPPPGKLLGQAGNQYRVSLPLDGTATQAFAIVQERVNSSKVGLDAVDLPSLKAYLLRSEMNESSRGVLTRLKDLREAKASADSRRSSTAMAIERVSTEQERLRENLKASQANSTLQRRYAASLEQTEKQIESLSQQLNTADNAVLQAAAAIDAFLKQ